MKKTLLPIIFFCCTLVSAVYAGEYPSDPGVLFRSYTVRDGLPHISVTSLMQDSRGFLFIGTYDGLGIFDGMTFRTHKYDPDEPSSIINNRIQSMLEHSMGKIFIGTEQGLCVYNPVLDTFEETGIHSIDGQIIFVSDLYEDSRQRLWVLTNSNYLFVADLEQGHYERILLINSTSCQDTRIMDIIEDKQGNIWIATGQNLFCYDTELKSINLALPVHFNSCKYNALLFDQHDYLWIASDNGLYQFNCRIASDEVRLELQDSYLKGIPISNILFDAASNLWVGSYENGLFRFLMHYGTVTAKEQYSEDLFVLNTLKNNTVNCLLEDRVGGIWIGGPNYGLSYYNPENIFFQSFSKQNGMPGNILLSACKFDSETVLLGLHRKGICVYNVYKNQIEDLWFDASDIASSSVHFIFVDSRQIVWFTTDHGLYYLLPTENRIRHFQQLKESLPIPTSFGPITEDDAGHLWLGHYNGVIRFAIDSKGQVESVINFNDHDMSHEHSNNILVKTIYNDPADASIWVGTYYHGLFRFTPKNKGVSANDYLIENYRYIRGKPESLQSDFVGHVLRDSRGRLWVGTEGGGFSEMVNKDGRIVFVNYLEKDGLSHNVVKCIVEDEMGRLFISTNNKLNYFDPLTSSFIHFSTSNGLKSDYFSNSMAELDDGRIILGGNKGISIVNPLLISEDDHFPEPYFGEFRLFSHTVKPGKMINNRVILTESLYYIDRIRLKHNQNNFSVNLSGVGFHNMDQVRLRYRLHGYDDDWLYSWATGNNMASYTKVPPGNYVLEYYVSNSSGNWIEHPKQLKIYISPPFWLTRWAVVLYALLALGIIYVTFAVLLKFERMKGNVRLSRLAQEKEQELTEAKLRFFTNISHEFRTPLTLINGPVDFILSQYHSNDFLHHNLALIKKQTNYLLRLLDQLLEFRKSEMKPLKMKWYKTDIVKFIWQISKSFDSLAIRKKIRFEYVSDEGSIVLYFDPMMIEKVVYNLLSNAFKFTSDGGHILLRISRVEGDKIAISVRDTGPGILESEIDRVFDRFYQGSNNTLKHGTGIGLSLSRLLVELHGGKIYAEHGRAVGAHVVMELPLGKHHLKDVEIVEDDKIKPSDIYLDLMEEDIQQKPSWKQVSNETNEKLKMVVVDDNADMCDFISDIFHDEFEVFQFRDSVIALNRIKKIRPDIVISDLLMPEMDGVELCRELRAAPSTGHTLFVILTGQYSSETRMKGLEAGADDFIIKPFQVDYLRVKVKNMLESRSRVKSRYNTAHAVKKSYGKKNTQEDEEFLYTVFSVIEQHISDPEFNNDNFSKTMAMSATKLNLKLKALTGKTPNELIRDYRVRKAANLLNNENYSISEVLSLCGFQSRSYFYKCFREVFNTAPKKYKNEVFGQIEPTSRINSLDWSKIIRK